MPVKKGAVIDLEGEWSFELPWREKYFFGLFPTPNRTLTELEISRVDRPVG